jgi:prepilin-type N-terminal cleavage/methylation domain-containing protein
VILFQNKIKNIFVTIGKICSDKSGFTLIEMSIAVGVVALMMAGVTTLIVRGLALQKESEKLRVAVILSQGKLSQLLTRPDLSPTSESGEIKNDNTLYAGYKYKIDITNERIDLAKISQTGKVSFAPVNDKLPEDTINTGKNEKMGEGVASQTGGLIDVMKIAVTIIYPRGDDTNGEYVVMTFRKK